MPVVETRVVAVALVKLAFVAENPAVLNCAIRDPAMTNLRVEVVGRYHPIVGSLV